MTFDVTPFIGRDEGQHFDRKSLYEGPADRKSARDRRSVRDQVAERLPAAHGRLDGSGIA